MILPIYLYGSEKLRAENMEADLQDKEGLAKLIADMKETLKVADGCGLAAPQVGVNLRVVIVDGTDLSDTYDYLKDFRRTMINPVVIEESEETCEFSEGCLSVPGIYAEVTRPSKIKVEYYNEDLENGRSSCRQQWKASANKLLRAAIISVMLLFPQMSQISLSMRSGISIMSKQFTAVHDLPPHVSWKSTVSNFKQSPWTRCRKTLRYQGTNS